MKMSQLVHAIRAACQLSGDSEVWVFGSQAVLGNFPHAELIESLSLSIEVDMTPKNKLEKVDDIDVFLGEGSQFHQSHGFYVHGVPVDEAARYPDDWKTRCVIIKTSGLDGREKYAHCVEIHDLIVGKLARYESKDMEFIRAAVKYGLADPNRIMERIRILNHPSVTSEQKEKMTNWCQHAIRNFNRPENEVIGPPYGQVKDGDPEISYPSDPIADGPECGIITEGIRCRRRGICPDHGQ